MKKLTPLLSVMLAIALVLVSMPKAQAATLTLQASGEVSQTVVSDEDGTLLAKVTQGSLRTDPDWSGLANLSVFSTINHSTSGKLEPGTSGSYTFALHNEYTMGPIEYKFKCEVLQGANVPIIYTVTRSGPGANTGTVSGREPAFSTMTVVPQGGSVVFTLSWTWAFGDSSTGNPLGIPDDLLNNEGYNVDNPIGIAARESNLKHAVKLEFYIEAAKPSLTVTWKDGSGSTVYDTWPGIASGMTIAQAADHVKRAIPLPTKSGHTFKGFKDKDGRLIIDENGNLVAGDYKITEDMVLFAQWEKDRTWPDWLWPVLGIGGLGVGAAGLTIGGLTLPWLIAIPALPVLLIGGWLLHRSCNENCGRPGCPAAKPDSTKDTNHVMPPKTGESWEVVLAAGMAMAVAAGTMAAMLKRRKREDTP